MTPCCVMNALQHLNHEISTLKAHIYHNGQIPIHFKQSISDYFHDAHMLEGEPTWC